MWPASTNLPQNIAEIDIPYTKFKAKSVITKVSFLKFKANSTSKRVSFLNIQFLASNKYEKTDIKNSKSYLLPF